MNASPTRTSGDPGPWSPELRWITIGLLLNVLGVAFETLAVAAVMPAVVADIGRQDLYGWVFSAYLLANLVGIVIGGMNADSRGPAVPFLWGTVLFTAGLVLGGFAPNMEMLIAARALQGLGGGGLASVSYVAVARAYPESARPKMLALLSTGWVVPGLVGPALAGFLAEGFGWRSVFLAFAPLPPLALALALPRLRTIPGGEAVAGGARRVATSIALSAGAGLLLAGLSQTDLRHALALAVPGLLVGLPALARLLPPGTLRVAPGLPAAIATALLFNLGMFGVDTFIPLALVDVRGQTVLVASLTITALAVTWTVGSWLQARIAPGGRRRALVMSGIVLMAAGCALMIPMLGPGTDPRLAPVFWSVAGIGIGLAFSTTSLIVLETAEPGQEGAASSAFQLVNQLGAGLGAGIGGAFVATIGHGEGGSLGRALTVHFALMVALLGVALLCALRLPVRHHGPADPA